MTILKSVTIHRLLAFSAILVALLVAAAPTTGVNAAGQLGHASPKTGPAVEGFTISPADATYFWTLGPTTYIYNVTLQNLTNARIGYFSHRVQRVRVGRPADKQRRHASGERHGQRADHSGSCPTRVSRRN